MYALQARNYERVVRLVEKAALAGRLESRLTMMLDWLEGVPEEMLLPWHHTGCAWVAEWDLTPVLADD